MTAFVCINPMCLAQSPRKPPPTSRRLFLRGVIATSLLTVLPRAPQASALPTKHWAPEDLCTHCSGCGKQACALCAASGVLTIDDSLVVQDNVCPNCQGAGSVRCPACIGLGLANTNGILRRAARDGSLRMLRDGSYEIMDCSAFPSCDIYGAERRSHM